MAVLEGLDIKSFVAFGNGESDCEMLKVCGVGVVMGNAPAVIRNVADLIIGTNQGQSFAQFLTVLFEL